MDDQQNLDSQSLKDRPWTTDEIRKHSSNWTLAGDVGLFNLLNEFSHNIISRTHEVENAVDSLVHQTKMTSAKINNVINDFHMLSNLQFVENRVYDEEIQETVPETKPVVERTKEQKEAEMLPKIIKAIELGLAVLDTAFDRINVNEISDSEDEEDISSEGRTILEPKDPYEQRPLPYIIGSEEFMKCDYAGLKELVEEEVQSFSEESSISETDETSSDEGEQLPLDDEDDKFSGKQTDQMSQNISDRISSSDESELFGSEKDVNGFVSDSSPDLRTKEKNIQRKPSIDAQPEKEARQNSVSSLQSKLKLPQVLPVPKLHEKKKEDDLFTNEEENSEDESPFRKKTGLFSSDVRFDEDEKDGDLFGGDLFGKSPSKDVKANKPKPPVEVAKVPPKQPQIILKSEVKEPTLFDNDEDSEDDIFNTLMKTKKPTLAKTSNASSQESSEKADTASTPSSAPSIKSSGNTFDFGGGNGDLLFGDDSDGEDLFSNKKATQRKKFDFASESDDLFGISSKPPKETKVTPETKPSLFEVSKAADPQPKSAPQKSLLVKKTKDSIFEDSDSSDPEKIVKVKSPVSAPVKTKTDGLFDDDDFEDDIFTQTAKKKTESSKVKKEGNLNLFDDEPKQDKSTKTKSVKKETVTKPALFSDDSEKEESIKTEPIKKETFAKQNLFADNSEKDENIKTKPVREDVSTKPSLFENDSEKESPKSVPKKVQPKQSSLFEDSDNFDLFAPKPSVKKAESAVPTQVPKPALDSTKAIDKTDGSVTSKVPSPSKDINMDSQISFDAPVDNSNVLNVINKGRAKITTKRRKPTRQGRLAALESSEKETTPDTAISDTSVIDDSSDNLFSTSAAKPKVEAESPKLNYKAQEKKKMNLMSQLISEVAISKVGLKKTVEKEKEEEEEEEEVDIFSEAVKGRSKSSFSFLPPEQNGIASMFSVEKKEEKEETLDVSKSDSFDDDFFTEPSFQNFRSSLSDKDPVLDLEDDDDDLFSTKTSSLPKAKLDNSDQNDLFDDDTDIFADVQKEKYEMFPNQIYEDEDDDIFGNISNTISNKPPNSSKTNNSSSVKKVETQQVNAFDDPLTGLLGED